MRSVGVEEELLLVDGETGRTVPVASALLRAADAQPAASPVEHELQEQQIETNSEPHESLETLREELLSLRANADRLAQQAGARVAALGTAPIAGRPRTMPDERYQRMAERYGRIEHQQLTCGCHVHVEVGSDTEAVNVLDRIRVWLPVLIAVTANSPFWAGEDSGYASYRTQRWTRWPSAGAIEVQGTPLAYDELVTGLLATGAALDRGMIYFDARLSESYSTVEVRVADVCPTVEDAVLLAGLSRALIAMAAEDWGDDPPPALPATVLHGASWAASRWGLGGELYDPMQQRLRPAEEVVRDLHARVRPALERHGDSAYVEAGLNRVLVEGTGADRQRAVFRQTGSLPAVVADAIDRTAGMSPPTT